LTFGTGAYLLIHIWLENENSALFFSIAKDIQKVSVEIEAVL